MKGFQGGCDQLQKDFGFKADCCSSCHEDANMGYYTEMFEIEFPDSDKWYRVCCRVSNAYDKVDAPNTNSLNP